MGAAINLLKYIAERVAEEKKSKLYISGYIITFFVVFFSGVFGWFIERLFFLFETNNPLSITLLFSFILSSSLASRSLNKSIFEILNLINKKDTRYNIHNIRQKLSLIVGRDVDNLDINEILRATAETASENSVDGIFAPLFWMFIGILFWNFHQLMPGPLAMAWSFKASSTIDSMLGYKEGNLKWLGFAGAKLDDLMTWIPARIVLITLPFCCRTNKSTLKTIKQAWKDGEVDSSPNSGISEAIFAYCAEVRLGGINYYKGRIKRKKIIAKCYPAANISKVKRILNLSMRLQLVWLLFFTLTIKFIT
tara:strand:- start:1485 stop:2408 length:924 start_codon:yes stop_codon:yes gene_type:complete